MDRLFKWLTARPHRPTVANLALLAALLAWVGSPILYGVAALLLARYLFLSEG